MYRRVVIDKMRAFNNTLAAWGIIGIIVFIINDYLYYRTNTDQTFLEHIIIGWLIFISTALTLILFYKEKKK